MLFGKTVNRYYLRYWYYFLGGVIFLIAVDIAQLEIPDITGSIIDDLTAKSLTNEMLVGYIKSLILIIIIMFVGRFFWRINVFTCGHKIENDLRKRMFSHMETLDQTYFNENKTGAQMALYTNDLFTIRRCFSQSTIALVDAIFLGTIAFYRMVTLNWVLALIASSPLLILAGCGVVISKAMRKKWEERQKCYSDLSEFAQENFSGFSVIKSFVKETKELAMFNIINRKNENKNVEFARLSVIINVLIGLLISTIMVIIGGVGAYLVYLNQTTDIHYLSIGDLNRYISYFGALVWPMMAISSLISMASQGRASLNRVDTLLNRKPLVHDDENSIKDADLSGAITFNHVNFAYPGVDENTLNDISFKIEKGESVGIIGRTGSGKTTIVDLLIKLYNVDKNMIYFDDYDIMDLSIDSIRNSIAFVPQDNFLFSDTVLNNISFSVPEGVEALSIEEARKYAAMADVDDDIMDFPNRYDTIMGERGVTLSGGQKQRVSIARALVKEAKILILDDSVSAVDTKTESKILTNLKAFHHNKTVIVIAHRISTIQHFDKIILVDNGKIVAIGKHDELYNDVSMYRDIVDLQHLEDQELEGQK